MPQPAQQCSSPCILTAMTIPTLPPQDPTPARATFRRGLFSGGVEAAFCFRTRCDVHACGVYRGDEEGPYLPGCLQREYGACRGGRGSLQSRAYLLPRTTLAVFLRCTTRPPGIARDLTWGTSTARRFFYHDEAQKKRGPCDDRGAKPHPSFSPAP